MPINLFKLPIPTDRSMEVPLLQSLFVHEWFEMMRKARKRYVGPDARAHPCSLF